MTKTYAPGTPNWVDLGTTDVAGAVAFYGSLFGWSYEDFGPEAGGYGVFLKDGRQAAGIGPAMDPARGSYWATYFATDSADDAASKVQPAGGQVIMEPMDVMDQGRMAVFVDPSGAFFSVWQPGKNTGAEVAGEPGGLAWNELVTTDIGAVKTFYPAVLGVGIRDVPMGEGFDYTLLQVDDRAVAGAMPQPPEAMAGMPSHWVVYFAVDDCDATHAKALELGAASLEGPMDSPAGRFATLVDPQGGKFAIIKVNPDFTP